MPTKRIGITIDEELYLTARVKHKNFSKYVDGLMKRDILAEDFDELYDQLVQQLLAEGYIHSAMASGNWTPNVLTPRAESDFQRAKRLANGG